MRYIYAALILGGLSACAPAIPDSGVGFDNSIEAQRAREAALIGSAPTAAGVAPPMAVSSEPLAAAGTLPSQPMPSQPVLNQPVPGQATAATGSESAEDIARETAAALAAVQANSGVMPLQASPSNPAPESAGTVGNVGLSDENDFEAVSSRESIASDAERIARNRALYQEIEPTALPSRTEDSQPNIVQYALQTRNSRGTPVYNRGGLKMASRTARNCAKYGSSDLAQIAFLSKGGPQRDRLGLDPDGDGFACDWDPAPFRQAVSN